MSARNTLLAELGLIDPDEADWRNRAACIGHGPDKFFPERGHSAAAAKEVCANCPVWQPCLEFALTTHDRLSVAGGRCEKERRVILRARRLGVPMPDGSSPWNLAPPEAPSRQRTRPEDAADATSRDILTRLKQVA